MAMAAYPGSGRLARSQELRTTNISKRLAYPGNGRLTNNKLKSKGRLPWQSMPSKVLRAKPFGNGLPKRSPTQNLTSEGCLSWRRMLNQKLVRKQQEAFSPPQAATRHLKA